MHPLRRIAFVGGFAALVACGGGGASSVAPGASNGTPLATTFAVTVAAASSVTRVGIASSAQSGSPEQSIAVAAGSPGCTATGTTRTCTASLLFPSGAQTLSIATYGATTVRSSVKTTLSGQRVTLAVGTSIAEISLTLAATSLAGGASGTTTLYVSAYDANGNTIVGAFANPIAITDSDTTGSISLSTTSVTAGGTNVTVTYNGSGNLSAVTFNASSSGVASTSIVPASLSFTSSQIMYVGAGGSILEFPMGASGDVAPAVRIPVMGVSLNAGAEPDGHGKIWTLVYNQEFTLPSNGAQYYGSQLASIPAGSSGPAAPAYLPLPANTLATDFGIDGAGNLYVLEISTAPAASIAVYAPGAQTPATVVAPAVLQTVSYCSGIAVATDGTFAITCADSTGTVASIYVFAAGASGAAAPVRTISGAATTLHAGGPQFGYSALTFAADGSLVTNDVNATFTGAGFTNGDAAVDVFAPGANGNVAPVRRIAGPGTGLDAVSFGKRDGAAASVGIDPSGAIYVQEIGSQSGLTEEQVLRWAPGANGAALPESVLAGPLTGLAGSAGSSIHFLGGTIAPPASSAPPSVSGDFMALAPGRGWNYTFQPTAPAFVSPPPAYTLSLYADPQQGGSTPVIAYALLGSEATALGNPDSVVAAEALFYQGTGGGYFAAGYVPVSSGASLGGYVPIPGDGIKITGGSLTAGQTFVPYLGLTATVLSVGTVPGATACPGGAATGAIVAYAFGYSTETVGFVPGCGITYLVTDNGSTAVLTSVGSYNLGTLSSARGALSRDGISSLRGLWRSVFTPWRAQ